jgi:hypothetical protein
MPHHQLETVMPKRPPPLPDADDLPEIEEDDSFVDAMPIDTRQTDRLSAEAEVSESLEDMSTQSFEDDPADGDLDFDDGADMGRHEP